MWATEWFMRAEIEKLEEENRKLKNSIEYWKKKADKNQEKADFIDKLMKLPGVMVNWKINRTTVAFYYGIWTDFYF